MSVTSFLPHDRVTPVDTQWMITLQTLRDRRVSHHHTSGTAVKPEERALGASVLAAAISEKCHRQQFDNLPATAPVQQREVDSKRAAKLAKMRLRLAQPDDNGRIAEEMPVKVEEPRDVF